MKTIKHQDKDVLVTIAGLLTSYANPSEQFDADLVAHVCSWQRAHGLTPDGIIGPKTWAAIAAEQPTLSTSKGKDKTNAVSALQKLLGGLDVDGKFGRKTKAAVVAYQSSTGLDADGICGPKTWTALLTGAVSLDVVNEQPVNYKQYDSRWGSIVYTSCGNSNQTIKNSGCGTTSVAMIIATWWDKSVTPKETSAEAVKKGYRTKNSGTDAGYFRYVAEKYGASKYAATSSWATAEACVRAGGLVIVNVGKSIWTSGGHYLLLWKVSNDTVYINDPASAKAERAKNKVATLKAAAKGYYCFWK